MNKFIGVLFVALFMVSAPTGFARSDFTLGDKVELKAIKAQGVPLHERRRSPQIFGRAPDGETGEVIRYTRNGRWFKVRLSDGREGWVTRRYLRPLGSTFDDPVPIPGPGSSGGSNTASLSLFAPPELYYNGTEDLQGALLEQRLQIIIDGHKQFAYHQVWDQLGYTDEDPLIPDNVILLYTGRSHPWVKRDQGFNEPEVWNREHVWAHSHGFPREHFMAYTDLHHLRPTDKGVNADRGNKGFDFSDAPYLAIEGARIDQNSFEPPDRVKGDVARMMFYMDIRYTHEGARGDLELVNETTDPREPRFGWLCTLLQWHELDPVDDWERRRNHRIFQRQGNRNPFIDHPEFADKIWASECG